MVLINLFADNVKLVQTAFVVGLHRFNRTDQFGQKGYPHTCHLSDNVAAYRLKNDTP